MGWGIGGSSTALEETGGRLEEVGAYSRPLRVVAEEANKDDNERVSKPEVRRIP